MQKSVDRAVGDLCGERALIVDAARDDEDQIGKLRPQALGEPLDRAGDGAGVENGDTRAFREQMRGEVGFSAYRENIVLRADCPQCVYQRLVP